MDVKGYKLKTVNVIDVIDCILYVQEMLTRFMY